MDARGHLVVPLQDIDGQLHSVETIAPDGAKRYLAGGAKRGHFCVVGAEPAPLAEPTGSLLICEGWATGASLAMATGHTVIAAMDAGNLLPVAEALRARFPEADLVLVADNDTKPDRDTNPAPCVTGCSRPSALRPTIAAMPRRWNGGGCGMQVCCRA